MRAVTPRDGGVAVEDHPDPTIAKGDVLVRVRAAGLNSADVLQMKGHYPAPPGSPQDILGMELAGEVAEVGEGVQRWSVGDRVMAIVGGGAQAELALLHERLLMPVPEGLSWAEAGGLPEVFVTAHDALFTQGRLQAGERLLVHGAAGGVGSAAVQLGVMAGARVTATVRSEGSRDAVAALGAEVLPPEGFEEHGPFDVILELVGAPNWPANLQALGTRGRICVIGVGAGPTVELNLQQLMVKRGTISASTLRARPLEDKADATRRVEKTVLPGFGRGLSVPIARTFPLEDAADAYAYFQQPGKHGKVVLELP